MLDLTHAVAGPHCTHHLQLLGADIVKVERPGLGDDMRHYTEHAGLKNFSAPFIAYNSGKRSVTLDLKAPQARPVLDRLIARSDVMVENFRPGVAGKLGLDYAAARGDQSADRVLLDLGFRRRRGRCATGRPTITSSRRCPG